MNQSRIVEVAELDFHLAPGEWDFAQRRAEDIRAHWEKRKAQNPRLFNGRVLLLGRHDYASRSQGGVVLRGDFLETDFANFLAWRDMGFPESNACNCFAMAALRGSDGAFLLGEMGPHTASPGAIYFAAGTPDPQDAFGDRVDLTASVRRELLEETGIPAEETAYDGSWTVVDFKGRIACMKTMRLPIPADAARARIDAFLAADEHPELIRMHVVRGEADFSEKMPVFVRDYLRYALGQ